MPEAEAGESTTLAVMLEAVPVEQWQVQRLGIYDWWDGPTAGLCELALPACTFWFELWASRFRTDDVDDRLFRLSTLPFSQLRRLWSLLEVPYPAPGQQFSMERWTARKHQFDELLAARTATPLIVRTDDWKHFTAYWRLIKE
jgi:hypothetical protein